MSSLTQSGGLGSTVPRDSIQTSVANSALPEAEMLASRGRAVREIIFQGQPVWKRCCDLVIASTLTVVLLPVFVLVAIVIKIGSDGPIFFRQTRFGAMGKPFQIWKFRTMVPHANQLRHAEYIRQQMQKNGSLSKLDWQAELIPLGDLMRRSTIDELPQLINVFRGEMSIIGPRPDVVSLPDYEPWQLKRFEVLPGVTGLWQVSGKNDTTFLEMMELDSEYVNRRSLWLDLKILALTPWAVLRQAFAKTS